MYVCEVGSSVAVTAIDILLVVAVTATTVLLVVAVITMMLAVGTASDF